MRKIFHCNLSHSAGLSEERSTVSFRLSLSFWQAFDSSFLLSFYRRSRYKRHYNYVGRVREQHEKADEIKYSPRLTVFLVFDIAMGKLASMIIKSKVVGF